MKNLAALILVFILSFGFIPGAHAQGPESIWMETGKSDYNADETITITLKANSASSFQGFTFQLRYDPACLQPVGINSLVSGLNMMSVPQSSGLVDAIFASTTPLAANNAALAEVKFNILAGCQTTVILENATLAAPDASGLAVPLQGISLGTSTFVLNTGGAPAVVPQGTSVPETAPTVLPETPSGTSLNQFSWLLMPLLALACLVLVIGVAIVAVVLSSGRRKPAAVEAPLPAAVPSLFIQRGPHAGTTLPLLVFPCRIGSGPENEISLSDTRISPVHAQILAAGNGFILADLGSQDGTFLNGKLLRSRQVPLKRGDVLRLGGVLLVFNPS